ncbi:MAG: ATP-binding cassette domain-containing protein [Saprospiraceae bacterium]|nr:ATP-binding cassette domain-containing protein [Saprospiraceae bacterium]
MLSINNISVRLNNNLLLKDLSFKLEPNSLLVLLGGNGAGKSMLLKTIAKSIPLETGSIFFMNKNLKDWSSSDLSTNRSVLSQNISLNFSMKVIDVVLLGRYPYNKDGGSTPNDYKIAKEVLSILGLEGSTEKNILELSGGEQQRVQIARVLAQIWDSSNTNPKLLLLDEPTSNLDIVYQHILLDVLLKRVSKNNLSVIIVLHDINLAARYATHIGLIKDGQLIKIGETEQTLIPELIKTTFGVSSVIQKHPILDCLQVSTF